MSLSNSFIKSNIDFYKNEVEEINKKTIVFLASKDIHMTSLTMKFSKAAAEVDNSNLIVVPNISCSRNILKILKSFKPFYIIKKEFHMLRAFIFNIPLLTKTFFSLKYGNDVVKIKIEGVEIGKHLYDYLLARFKLSTIQNLDFKLKVMILIDLIYYLSSIKLLKKYKGSLLILPDNAYRHGMVFEFASVNNLHCIAGISMTRFTAHKFDNSESYRLHCRTPSKSLINNILDNPVILAQAEQSYISRVQGLGNQHDVIRAYSSKKNEINKEELIKTMSLRKSKPIVMIAAHIFRDAPHAYPNTLFKDYQEWLKFTCLELLDNNEINFIVKEHPSANLYGELGKIESILYDIGCSDKLLPKNIKTSSLFNSIDVLVTCGGTAGMEFAYNGVPVCLAASPPYSNFGFSKESISLAEYKQNLKTIHTIPRLTKKQMITAVVILYVTNELMQAKNLSKLIGSQELYMGIDVDLEKFYEDMIEQNREGFGFRSLKDDIKKIIESKNRNILNIDV